MRLRSRTKPSPGLENQLQPERDRRLPDVPRSVETPPQRSPEMGGLSARVLIAMARTARRPIAGA